jgi:NAD(P)-dependent dehydrogenase (short-subunit alcohol dehydrogenase family)
MAAAVAEIEAAHGPIDILVNATHGANIKPSLEATLADWQTEIDRNATTAFVACQAVGKGMVARGGGRIINLVSVVHDRGVPNCAMFSASQAAVLGLTRSLGIEWGRGEALQRPRVTVNALGLGFYDGIAGPQGDENLHAILERYIPLRRLGQPADLQGAVVYLASDTTNYVQGELLMVDGAIANHA